MLKGWRLGTAWIALAALTACGGGGGGSGASSPPPSASNPPPPPPPAASACSLRERQNWAAAQLQEWYLFPETLPANPNPAGYATVSDYIDYLTSAARAQGRDRFFTYLTSIAEENAYYQSGSSAGFGIRLSLDPSNRLLVTEAFEGAPALAAGIDRGTEILAIGTNGATLRSVATILASEGSIGLTNALGPTQAGVSRVLRVSDAGGTRDVTVAKADFELQPVSERYGARIIDDGGRRVGYINLRTFISTADPALVNAFAQFRAQGITDIILDLRYNGGGLVSTAELLGDLLGGNRSTGDVFSFTRFRTSKAQFDETRNFQPRPESVSPTRIAFIGTEGSASASELVINAFVPYLRQNAALVGTNTYGKPVGQIGLDRPECDDRLRVVAFATRNRDNQGDYYFGLANTVEASCQAPDDLTRPLGDPQESSVARALDFLAGRPCTAIARAAGARRQAFGPRRELLAPERPSTAQREVPGLF